MQHLPEHHQCSGDEGDKENDSDAKEHLPLVNGCYRDKIQDDDPQTVEPMKEDCAEKQNFAHSKDGMVVKLHHGIKQVTPPTDEGNVNDVNEQEDENSDACQAMQKPSPHA
jgi:hypothetical protein